MGVAWTSGYQIVRTGYCAICVVSVRRPADATFGAQPDDSGLLPGHYSGATAKRRTWPPEPPLILIGATMR